MGGIIEAIDIKRKMFFEHRRHPLRLPRRRRSPRPTARGGQTLVRVKMRNLMTRAVFDKTFKAGDKFKEPDLAVVPRVTSTATATGSHFMDQETLRDAHPRTRHAGRRRG